MMVDSTVIIYDVKTDDSFARDYSNTEEAFDAALRLMHKMFDDSHTPSKKVAGVIGRKTGLAWVSRFLYNSANRFEVGDGSYRGPLRWVLGYAARILAFATDTDEPERPPYTIYGTPKEALWPDWDIKGDKLNGWEYAMWGKFVTDDLYEDTIHDTSRNRDLFIRAYKAQKDRETALSLLEWIVRQDAPPRTPAEIMHAAHHNRTVSRTTADALWVLGETYFWGLYHVPAKMEKAAGYFEQLAALGNATAHSRLAFLKGSALMAPNATHAEKARSLTHYVLAAEGGDRQAQLALAYRYATGFGIERNCNESFVYSEAAARNSIIASGGSFYTRAPTYTKISLPALERHPPVVLAGMRAHTSPVRRLLNSDPRALSNPTALLNHLEINWYNAERGFIGSQMYLARVLYQGSAVGPAHRLGAVKRDVPLSYRLAQAIVDRVFNIDMHESLAAQQKNPQAVVYSVKLKDREDIEIGGRAAELIATMIMRREISRPLAEARVFLALAILACDSSCPNARAKFSFLERYDKSKERPSYESTVELLSGISAADVYVELALVSLENGKYVDVPALIESAWLIDRMPYTSTMLENSILLQYTRGMFYSSGVLQFSDNNCKIATQNMRDVAHMGDWEDPMFHRGEAALAHGDERTALRAWAISAESGERIAQENVAFMFDPQRSYARGVDRPENAAVAIEYWVRAALQDSNIAFVRLGDYLQHGIGMEAEVHDAMSMYGSVSPVSLEYAEAMYALGNIYESGVGIERHDLNLAKRHYDTSLTMSNGRGELAVFYALVRLHWRASIALLRGDPSARKLFAGYASRISQLIRKGASIYEESAPPKLSQSDGAGDGARGSGSGSATATAASRQTTSILRIRMTGVDMALFVTGAVTLVILYAARRRVARDLHNAQARLQEARDVT
ncbi:ERAD-associated protein [Malassezia cuniculi]|uniref:ERAD-associated protein n=1 Tax=Malassezia cuniculi TaxID=948313 RepID=A0AAF0EQA4_9BASI|nr:ERAD-associated protein [Malassezia cuniculi]